MSPSIGFVRSAKGHPIEKNDGFEFVWLESPLSAVLDYADNVKDWNDMTKWPSGRLFGDKGEYRWKINSDDTLHCVLLLDDGHPPDDFKENIELEKPADEDEHALFLWGGLEGQNKDRSFYANELPKPQSYPVKGAPMAGEYLSLVVRTYRAKDRDDMGEFARCVSVKTKELVQNGGGSDAA